MRQKKYTGRRRGVPTPGSKGPGGFTLVELMVAVAIIAIIGMVAGPELMDFGTNMRTRAAAREAHATVQKIKIMAAKRNSDVVLLATPVTCTGARTDELVPSTLPTPGGTLQAFVDNGAGTGTMGDGIRNGDEEWFVFNDELEDDVDPPQPITTASGPKGDIDYDMPPNTALCEVVNTQGTAVETDDTAVTSIGFNSRAMRLNSTEVLFVVKNDKGRIYTVTVSLSGSILTDKI